MIRGNKVIHWSAEDQTFVVSLPEFGPYCKTHGHTYEEAVRKGGQAMLISTVQERGESLPPVRSAEQVA
jgi:predicted RNase H-like HicB family nuclease